MHSSEETLVQDILKVGVYQGALEVDNVISRNFDFEDSVIFNVSSYAHNILHTLKNKFLKDYIM